MNRLNILKEEDMNELREIITEYEKMSRKSHPNLLNLRGYSYY
jgi:hypothetical protein